ncbi:MAG: hypothetical protein IJ662_05940 [Clostridia bacterium]|nr:hypothetical protein [Clostridia bacterium]
MREENLKQTLEKAFPETPALFHDRMRDALIVRPVRGKSRRIGGVALICALALMVCGGALAAMKHYGVLNFNAGWNDDFYFTLPGAESMIHYDLAEAATGDLTWKVKEAAYDGRVLRILYSMTDPTLEVTENNIDEALYAMQKKNGVYLECEGNGEIYVNGLGVNLSTMDYRPGEKKGEIEGWFDCKMEGYETNGYVKPEGEIAVWLPFHFDDEQLKRTSPGGLQFTMNVGDAASRYAIQLPPPYTLPSGSVVTFTDLHFSPVTVFMDVEISFPAEREVPKNDNYDQFFKAIEEMPESQAFWDAYMANEKGEALGAVRDGEESDRFDDQDRLILQFHFEFAPSDRYTAVNYLCLGDQGKVPIPMIYQEKSAAAYPTPLPAAPQATAPTAWQDEAYQQALRAALKSLMGLPEEVTPFPRFYTDAGYGDGRACYGQVYWPADASGRVWNGLLSIRDNTLVRCEYTGGDLRWITMEDDTRLDANDPAWRQMAVDFVNALRDDGGKGIAQVENLGEIALNSAYGVAYKLTDAQGGAYTVEISYPLRSVIRATYRDAAQQAFADAYREPAVNQ